VANRAAEKLSLTSALSRPAPLSLPSSSPLAVFGPLLWALLFIARCSKVGLAMVFPALSEFWEPLNAGVRIQGYEAMGHLSARVSVYPRDPCRSKHGRSGWQCCTLTAQQAVALFSDCVTSSGAYFQHCNKQWRSSPTV
jgi:hypothetical protein